MEPVKTILDPYSNGIVIVPLAAIVESVRKSVEPWIVHVSSFVSYSPAGGAMGATQVRQ